MKTVSMGSPPALILIQRLDALFNKSPDPDVIAAGLMSNGLRRFGDIPLSERNKKTEQRYAIAMHTSRPFVDIFLRYSPGVSPSGWFWWRSAELRSLPMQEHMTNDNDYIIEVELADFSRPPPLPEPV